MPNACIADFKTLLANVLTGDRKACYEIRQSLKKLPPEELQEAKTLLENLLQEQPSHAFINFLMGAIYCIKSPHANNAKAINHLERAIELGEPFAMNTRGYMHQHGQGGSVNYGAAIELYERAMRYDNAYAIFNRGYMHHKGQGGPVNFESAIALYDRAIELGDPFAMYMRGYMHHQGGGGPVNFESAIALYERAIQYDNASAMCNRAYMHQHGQGGPVNYEAAIALYERAIRYDLGWAMTLRAEMYQQGLGGSKDLKKASELYQRSFHADINKRDEIIKKMAILAKNDINTGYFLAKLYYFGDQHIKANPKTALPWMKKPGVGTLVYNHIINNFCQFNEHVLDEHFIFLTKNNLINKKQAVYLQFKILTIKNNNEALDFYLRESTAIEPLFTKDDFFLMASATLDETAVYPDKDITIKCLDRASRLFYKAYLAGDTNSLPMLKECLARKESLSLNIKPQYPQPIANEHLFSNFQYNFKKKINKTLLIQLEAFLKTTQIEAKPNLLRFFCSKHPNKTITLAQDIIVFLKENKPLEEILQDSSIKNRMNDCPNLRTFIDDAMILNVTKLPNDYGLRNV